MKKKLIIPLLIIQLFIIMSLPAFATGNEGTKEDIKEDTKKEEIVLSNWSGEVAPSAISVVYDTKMEKPTSQDSWQHCLLVLYNDTDKTYYAFFNYKDNQGNKYYFKVDNTLDIISFENGGSEDFIVYRYKDNKWARDEKIYSSFSIYNMKFVKDYNVQYQYPLCSEGNYLQRNACGMLYMSNKLLDFSIKNTLMFVICIAPFFIGFGFIIIRICMKIFKRV